MANKTRVHYPGHPGVWPGGEPASVRAAADEQLRNELAVRDMQRTEAQRRARDTR